MGAVECSQFLQASVIEPCAGPTFIVPSHCEPGEQDFNMRGGRWI